MTTVLGVDLGTQSLKALVYHCDTQQVAATASASLSLRTDRDGSAEQTAGDWFEALQQSLREIDPELRRAVAAIAVSGQQHGLVALDREGTVLAPVKLWCDTSTANLCDSIMAEFGGTERCIEVLGNPILPGYTASKIRWLKEQRPTEYERLETILLPHDYLNFRLTGERAMEYGDASGTGLLDIRERHWSDDMLRALDPDRNLAACLPPLREAHEVIGHLREDVAAQLGLPAGIPVATGGGDNMMGAIGTGNVRPGVVTMSLGTSGTLYAYSDRPVIDPRGEVAAFCSSTGGWLPLFCSMNCTVSSEITRDYLNIDLSQMEQQLSQAPPGAEGLITVPFFNGERTPNLPGAAGTLFGLSSHNATPANILRSAVEGSTFALRYGLERFRELGLNADEIRLTGGGANSPTWRQLVADVCKAPVSALHNESAALGAALQAFWALQCRQAGRLLPLEDISRAHITINPEETCTPDPATSQDYDRIYSDYCRAVDAVGAYYR